MIWVFGVQCNLQLCGWLRLRCFGVGIVVWLGFRFFVCFGVLIIGLGFAFLVGCYIVVYLVAFVILWS